jgi:hypothetical protein
MEWIFSTEIYLKARDHSDEVSLPAVELLSMWSIVRFLASSSRTLNMTLTISIIITFTVMFRGNIVKGDLLLTLGPVCIYRVY